jgi:hypothetical protein
MSTIQVKHDDIIKKLETVKQALATLHLPNPNQQVFGKNKLDFTDRFKTQETAIATDIASYIEIVAKNVEDTRSNVDSFKQQDEAIGNSIPK